MYLIHKDDNNVKFLDSLLDLGTIFRIHISQDGSVFLNGEEDSITYNLKDYTLDEVYVDFVKTRLIILLKRKGYKLYKCEEL